MKKMVSNIVFTKNRPLQLDAYLESLYRYFPSQLIQTYIIYKMELFDEQYQQLFRKYTDCIVIKESDFHADFLNLLGQISTKYILFGIDDVVYFDSVDFDVIDAIFDKFSDDIFGFSLRSSEQNIRDSDPLSETTIAGQTVYSLSWTQGRTPATRYPFELCATIYPTVLVKRVIAGMMNSNPLIKKLFSSSSALVNFLAKFVSKRKILKYFGYFYNPNTLESWNCRWCQNHSNQLPRFLYFQRFCASAIQVNTVNVSAKKTFDSPAEFTVETLAEKYRQGFRLDIVFVSQNRPMVTQAGAEYFRLTKNQLNIG
jgi:hypothetical protein